MASLNFISKLKPRGRLSREICRKQSFDNRKVKKCDGRMDFFLRPLIFYPKGFIIEAEMRKRGVFTGISAPYYNIA